MADQCDIARIAASGVLGEFGYKVDFGEGRNRMRVIYAENGRGKTNFLRAVSFALNPAVDGLQSLVEIPIRQLVIEFNSGASLRIERKDAFSPTYTAVAQPSDEGEGQPATVTVDPADFAGRLYRRAWDERENYVRYAELVKSFSRGSSLLGDDRLAPSEDGRDNIRVGGPPGDRRKPLTVVSGLLARVERMLTQFALERLSRESETTGVYAEITKTTLQGARSLATARARADLENRIKTLLMTGAGHESYGLLSLRQVRDISTQLEKARANDKNLPALHKILKPYLDSLQDQVESLTPAQELIDTFVTAVNQFLDRKRLAFSTARGIKLYGRDGAVLHPESLSSGERHLLLLLAHAVLATADKPLVIIDEPEISLGLEWQRDLLNQLLRCTSSADVQFLIASHSVQIMGELPSEDIIRPSEA